MWLLWGLLAGAEPVTLLHQGRLLDASGQPITGSHSVSVALYPQATVGAPHWQDSFELPVSDGYYSLTLGYQQVLDTEDLLMPQVYVQVTLGSVGLRQQLVSMPYAAVARSVDEDRGVFSGAITVRVEDPVYCEASLKGRLMWDNFASMLRICDGERFVPLEAVK